MKREPKNIAASIQARLLQRSRELNVEHQLTLARFGGERLLYRLSKSEFADRFILKGAALRAIELKKRLYSDTEAWCGAQGVDLDRVEATAAAQVRRMRGDT